MLNTALVFITLASIIHVYIWIVESFLWTKPRTLKTFGMTAEVAKASKPLAFNQGFYNLFLAIVAFSGVLTIYLWHADAGYTLILAGGGSMIMASLILYLSDRKKARAALIQFLAPTIGLVLIAFA